MTPAPIKPEISIDLLEKIDTRVGTIRSVEDMSYSDKLVKLKVGLGDHERTIRCRHGKGAGQTAGGCRQAGAVPRVKVVDKGN